MTERERWIVYPLLFLALGAALRDKLSEHTKTKRIECQELIVYGEDSAGQPGIPLVEIGSMERTSAQSPHVGKIAVNGLIAVDGLIQGRKVEAEVMQASNVNADHYFFQRIPFAPLMRGGPGMSAADQLRALQLQQQAASAEKAAQGEPPAAKERPEEQPQDAEPQPQPAAPTTSPEETNAPSE